MICGKPAECHSQIGGARPQLKDCATVIKLQQISGDNIALLKTCSSSFPMTAFDGGLQARLGPVGTYPPFRKVAEMIVSGTHD